MGNKKSSIFDYVMTQGNLSFQESEFNEVDALVLSVFAYLDFSSIDAQEIVPFSEAIEGVNKLPEEFRFSGPTVDMMRSIVSLANDAVKTLRYRDMGVFNYTHITDEKEEIQFAAVTFILPDDTAFISFRGTDNSLVGWKEDFNMSFIYGVPSQIKATKYATETAKKVNRSTRLGGHSKGGNLAVWASTYLPKEYQESIIHIYSNDGPGFTKEFLNCPEYLNIRKKISFFVPVSSIVGVLMEHDEYTSICSTNPFIFQHDPFSWRIDGTHLLYGEAKTLYTKQFERVINSWIRAMSPKEREELIDMSYNMLTSSHAKTIDDLDKAKIKSFLSMQKTFRKMGLKKQRQLVLSLSKVIFNSDILVNSNLFTLLSDNEESKEKDISN